LTQGGRGGGLGDEFSSNEEQGSGRNGLVGKDAKDGSWSVKWNVVGVLMTLHHILVGQVEELIDGIYRDGGEVGELFHADLI